jgi:RNA polymerase sigma-70 factor (sigma-E family)
VRNRTRSTGVEESVDAHTAAEPVLARALVSGDSEAETFEAFFGRAWPGAVRLVALLTQDRSAAEELAQDAFARMFASWERVSNPDAYLRRALVNRSHNWRRRGRVREAKLALLAGAATVELPAAELADAVACLPFRQRAVIVLRYYGGLSEAEIGAALGCRNGTVKSLAARGLATLERVIER